MNGLTSLPAVKGRKILGMPQEPSPEEMAQVYRVLNSTLVDTESLRMQLEKLPFVLEGLKQIMPEQADRNDVVSLTEQLAMIFLTAGIDLTVAKVSQAISSLMALIAASAASGEGMAVLSSSYIQAAELSRMFLVAKIAEEILTPKPTHN